MLHEGYLEFGAIKAIDWTPIFSHFHVAYITYLRSENMMGIFQENNVDDYGLMLPQNESTEGLAFDLKRETHEYQAICFKDYRANCR